MVNKYESVVIVLLDEGDKDKQKTPYFEAQKDIYEVYTENKKVISKKELTYTIYGNIYVKFNLAGIMN